MAEKIEQLDLLVSQMLSRQSALQQQNAALAKRVRDLEQTETQLKQAEKEAKELREWKKNTQNVLRRLAVKIDKEIDKAQQAQDKIA